MCQGEAGRTRRLGFLVPWVVTVKRSGLCGGCRCGGWVELAWSMVRRPAGVSDSDRGTRTGGGFGTGTQVEGSGFGVEVGLGSKALPWRASRGPGSPLTLPHVGVQALGRWVWLEGPPSGMGQGLATVLCLGGSVQGWVQSMFLTGHTAKQLHLNSGRRFWT